MENCWEEKKTTMVEEPLLEEEEDDDDGTNGKGGFRTLPFIIGNESLEKMATYGLSPNMTLYLMREYGMEMTTTSTLLFMWSATTNFMPLLGALLADSLFGRFYTIGFGSLICLVGMILLWSTTMIPQARPQCNQSTNTCSSVTTLQFAYLCTSFALISVGAGGIRASSLAFGANQLENAEFKKRSNVKESYFSWYYASYAVSILIAYTCIVYVQDNMGWRVGFAVPALSMMLGVGCFFVASPLYVKLKSKSSLVTGLVQVVVASFRNRHLKLLDGTNYVWHCKDGSSLSSPSEKLRFLNKACVVRDPETELTLDQRAKDPWSLCTVDQVEELKALLKIVPIWSTGMIMNVNVSQNSFPVLQASSMDRRLTSGFTIPAASFATFAVISAIIWIALYDRVFLPVASRILRRPVHISTKTRMGIGIFFSFLAVLASAVVEGIRRSLAIKEGYTDQPMGSVHMSALWLVPQNCLVGFAEASNAIGQNEFYFSEFPRSMSSIATTLNAIGLSVANLIASFVLNGVDYLSSKGGNESWISSNINKGHYDYYYMVLAGISLVNMIYFVVCSRAYGPLKEEREEEDQVM